MDEILRVEGLTKFFGGLPAVNHLSLSLEEGRITGLIGPNGSGKTTTFNLITGVTPIDAGRVEALGQDMTGWPPHRIAVQGLVRTFQISRVFGQLTVWENMIVVARG